MSQWRVGKRVPINVYEDARPVCQCHNPEDAARIVEAMNAVPPPGPKDVLMEELSIGVRAYNILNLMNLKTASSIVAAGRRAIYKAHMCGRKTVADIEYELNKAGWHFAEPAGELGVLYEQCLERHRAKWTDLDAKLRGASA